MAERLDQPRTSRRTFLPRFEMEKDASGRISESIARFLGSWRFIGYMSAFIAFWIVLNVGPWAHPDPFPFIFLTLLLSLQASYAAPLILLAQNRQADRDRVQAEQDRQGAERNLADTEFLAREVAALRIALSEVATRDFVRSELRDLLEDLTAERETPEKDPSATPPDA